VLKRAFGLTRREAALASALSTGKPIDAAADEIGMAYETARSHLRRIFDKTQTSRQTELMTVLARLPKD
jgi:DNA-binding CsgD family transcriptional regulator